MASSDHNPFAHRDAMFVVDYIAMRDGVLTIKDVWQIQRAANSRVADLETERDELRDRVERLRAVAVVSDVILTTPGWRGPLIDKLRRASEQLQAGDLVEGGSDGE